MITLYQYCDKCKTERNFDPETLNVKPVIKRTNEFRRRNI